MTDLPVLQLMPARVGLNGYTPADRYHDFNAVFCGATAATEAQKARCLYQLLDECGHNDATLADAQNPYITYMRCARWEIAQTLLTWITSEPAPMPEVERQSGDLRDNV